MTENELEQAIKNRYSNMTVSKLLDLIEINNNYVLKYSNEALNIVFLAEENKRLIKEIKQRLNEE